MVLQPTQYEVQMYIPGGWEYNGYTYGGNGLMSTFILFKFAPTFIIDPNNVVNISSTLCSSIYVYYAAGIIRCFPILVNSWGWYTYYIYNLPTSAYAVTNQTVTVVY